MWLNSPCVPENFVPLDIENTPAFVVVVVSHIQRIRCQSEKNVYTVANPALDLLNRGKKTENKKSGSSPLSPHSRCLFGGNKMKTTWRIYMPKRYTNLGHYITPSSRGLSQLMSLRRFYASVCGNSLPSLVASLVFWRYLVASIYFFLHAAANLRLPSVTV